MNTPLIIILIVISILGIFGIHSHRKDEKRRNEQRELKRKEYELAENAVQEEIKRLIEQYGEPTNIVKLGGYTEKADIKKRLLVFGQSSLIYVDGQAILFKDIISYNIDDEYQIKHGVSKYTSESSTSTGSLVARGVTGAVLGGTVGAAIGASSASKNINTVKKQENDIIIHNYKLSIRINNLKNPLIRIELGYLTEKAEEVNAILSVITNQTNY